MYEIAIDKANNHISHLWLRLKGITKPHLYILIVTKATGNGKYYCRNGHDSQQGGIRQRRCLLHDALGSKEANGKYKFLNYLQKEEFQWRHVVLIDSPDINLKELDDCIYSSTHDILSS